MALVVDLGCGRISSPGIDRRTSWSVAPHRCCHGWTVNRYTIRTTAAIPPPVATPSHGPIAPINAARTPRQRIVMPSTIAMIVVFERIAFTSRREHPPVGSAPRGPLVLASSGPSGPGGGGRRGPCASTTGGISAHGGVTTPLVGPVTMVLLAPTLVLASVLLLRVRPVGFVMGTAVSGFGAAYQINLMASGVFQANADVPGVKAFPLESIILTVGFVVASLILLLAVRGARREGP